MRRFVTRSAPALLTANMISTATRHPVLINLRKICHFSLSRPGEHMQLDVQSDVSRHALARMIFMHSAEPRIGRASTHPYWLPDLRHGVCVCVCVCVCMSAVIEG